MESTYTKLNMSKLTQRNRKMISTYEALKKVTPVQWKDTAYTGNERVVVSEQGINYVQNR